MVIRLICVHCVINVLCPGGEQSLCWQWYARVTAHPMTAAMCLVVRILALYAVNYVSILT